MRTPVTLGAIALALVAGIGIGLWVSQDVPRPEADLATGAGASRSALPVTHSEGSAGRDEMAALRARVRELEDQLAAEGEAPAGAATSLHVPVRPEIRTLDLQGMGGIDQLVDGQLPPEITAEITAALEGALGMGELDCDNGDCVLLGPDGQPMEGVHIQTMGDFDPEEIGALLQGALGDRAIVGEPSVGVMILEAEVDAEIIED